VVTHVGPPQPRFPPRHVLEAEYPQMSPMRDISSFHPDLHRLARILPRGSVGRRSVTLMRQAQRLQTIGRSVRSSGSTAGVT
jgi:hypothetical protein